MGFVADKTEGRFVPDKALKPMGPLTNDNPNPIDDFLIGKIASAPGLGNAPDIQGSIPGRFIQGMADMPLGAIQLGANALGLGGQINKRIAEINARTEALRGPDAGFDVARLAGNIASPVALATAAKVPLAATRLGKIGQGAAIGAVGGATAPVTEEPTSGADFATTKAAQTIAGAGFGAAIPAAAPLVTGTVKNVIGGLTGTSAETLSAAFNAGKKGASDFIENMRGKVPFEDIVDRAKEGLMKMRKDRGEQYRSGMVDIKGDKSVLDMAPIVQSVEGIKSSGNFKGKVINEKSSGIVGELEAKVNDWAKSNPEEFHTPEGLDALKQAIGDIRDSTQFGTSARRAADQVYNAVKGAIQKQAPTYSKVMKDYSEASEAISEIEKTLSLGNKGSKDAAIRKLQSLMRNNAQTNYGNRLQVGKALEEGGNVELMPSIAGQAMNTWLPRGMVGALEKVGTAGAAMFAPKALMLAPFMSPRLMGEAAYGTGRLSSIGRGVLSKQLTATGVNAKERE